MITNSILYNYRMGKESRTAMLDSGIHAFTIDSLLRRKVAQATELIDTASLDLSHLLTKDDFTQLFGVRILPR